MYINRSFILILNVLFFYTSAFLEQRYPTYTQLCSGSVEALGSCAWPWEFLERLCLGGNYVSDITSLRLPTVGQAFTVSCEQSILCHPGQWKEGAYLYALWIPLSFHFRLLTLLWEQIDGSFNGFAPVFLWVQSLQLQLLCLKGVREGVGAFPCSSASLHLGQDSLEGH